MRRTACWNERACRNNEYGRRRESAHAHNVAVVYDARPSTVEQGVGAAVRASRTTRITVRHLHDDDWPRTMALWKICAPRADTRPRLCEKRTDELRAGHASVAGLTRAATEAKVATAPRWRPPPRQLQQCLRRRQPRQVQPPPRHRRPLAPHLPQSPHDLPRSPPRTLPLYLQLRIPLL